jgi:precorrin-6B methylase 2
MQSQILSPLSIESEIAYFKPMLKREQYTSEIDRLLWRQETIRQRQERISLEVFDRCKGIIQYGAFQGMKLSKETWWGKSDLGSQCLGLYEKEILDFIKNITTHQYENFIDIGAADGYYGIGMLLAKKCKQSICFEISKEGRKTIQKNSIANGVAENIYIQSEASTQSIAAISDAVFKNSLIMIDIEGSEFDLLNEKIFEKFSNSTILIEIHNWVDNFEEKYTALLRNSFIHHIVEVIKRVERPTLHLEELRDFTDDNRLLLISERRPCVMRFLKLTPLHLYAL